jgi:protein involved in polysaccharide export with SLBB domain
VDGRGLSHDLLPVLLGYTRGFLPRTSVNQLTLIPAAGYGFQPGSGIVAEMSYTVGLDGTVSYPASCDGFLGGSGTSTLIVEGYPIFIDAIKADSDLLSLVNIGLAAQAPRFLFAVLVPANGYDPQTANGVFSSGFAVHQNGSITFPADATDRYVLSTVPRLEIEGATPF